jgi:hypothetical protein
VIKIIQLGGQITQRKVSENNEMFWPEVHVIIFVRRNHYLKLTLYIVVADWNNALRTVGIILSPREREGS